MTGAPPAGAPSSERAAMRGLGEIARRIHLVGYATPANLTAELRRVGAAWAAGRAVAPRFTYRVAPDLAAERLVLVRARDEAAGVFAEIVAARAHELWLEASACEAVGTASFWGLARARFPHRDGFDAAADRLADEWSADPPEAVDDGAIAIASDDAFDPRSLVCAMRRAVGEHRLPFRVVVSPDLAPLAATGDKVIFVAAGRRVSAADVERTVLHEILGHALPSARSTRSAIALFGAGTAFGADDQEGRALVLEERAGFLHAARCRELALRHLAARTVEARAGFVETARRLLAAAAGTEQALRIAARVHRGGGLAREATYLPALLRVRAALAETPALEGPLGSGRVSVGAARVMLSLAAP